MGLRSAVIRSHFVIRRTSRAHSLCVFRLLQHTCIPGWNGMMSTSTTPFSFTVAPSAPNQSSSYVVFESSSHAVFESSSHAVFESSSHVVLESSSHVVFRSLSYVVFKSSSHVYYNHCHMLYSNPRHMFIRILITCYIRILFNAFINHIHKQSVMTGNIHNILAAYKYSLTSPGMPAFNSQGPAMTLVDCDHHPLRMSNCPGNGRDF